MIDPNTALQLKRTLAAPRERVFKAWTDPEILKKWWGPEGCVTPSAQIDLQVGGAYRFEMQFPPEPVFYLSGIYREIRPPERLVFTWRWEFPGSESEETLVTVEFHAQGNTTEIILTHEQFPHREAVEQHQQGWDSIFTRLAQHFEGKEG